MAKADPTTSVRAVLFISPQCAPCQDLYSYLLPSLAEHYGDRLTLAQVDVTQPAGALIYQAAASSYGLGAWQGVPVAVVGKKALVGVDAIAAALGDGFDALSEATRWPDLPGLASLLPEGIRALKAQSVPVQRPSPPTSRYDLFMQDPIGNALAIVVLCCMVLVFAHVVVRLRRRTDSPQPIHPLHQKLLPWVMLVGAFVSVYTAYAALAHVAPLCGPVGDCSKVQSSEYAHLFGIPLGIFGIIGWATILVTWVLARRFSPQGGGWHWLPWAVALAGFLFSLRLTTLEPFVIGATCLWCISSALSMTAALWLLTGAVAR